MTEIWQQSAVITWSQIILNSYQRLLGKELILRNGDPLIEAKQLFYAPMVVLSHNTNPDPIYNYGNLQALELWEMTWEQLVQTPSKSTTEPELRSQRENFLVSAKMAKQGYINNYEGIRVSSTGKRYKIQDVIIWNLTDEQNQYCGQAATFADWQAVN